MKGLFRRGVALARRGLDLDGAELDLTRVIALEPDNADAAKELKLLSKKMRASEQNAKKMFANFFKETSEKGDGYYEGVEAIPDPHAGLNDTEKVAMMPDTRMKDRAKYLMEKKEKAEAEQSELAAKLAEMEKAKRDLEREAGMIGPMV